MKDSSHNIVDIADYVTDGNNDEGVAKVLEKFLLDKNV